MTDQDFERVVKAHYAMLYRFALSLTRSEAEASDLTQESFYILATKADDIRDPAKIQSWLFTTLRRLFLGKRRHASRFPHFEISTMEHELPRITSKAVDQMDCDLVMEALMEIDEVFREPLILFYFRNFSYKEIAEILGTPAGTIMSRLARGKEQIRNVLAGKIGLKKTDAV